MQQVDISKLDLVNLKAMAYDKSMMVNLLNSEIEALHKEIRIRSKDADKVSSEDSNKKDDVQKQKDVK